MSQWIAALPMYNVTPRHDALEEVLERSDLLILSTPHRLYKDLQVDAPIIDIWGVLGNGTAL